MIKRILALLLLFTYSPAYAMGDPAGNWRVADGSAHIRVVHCGMRLWGYISWAKEPGVDSHNPDADLRSRSIPGLPILLGMHAAQPGRWDGDIYNADNGKTYSGHIAPLSADALRVEGCVLGFLCGGETWTRIPDGDAPGARFTCP